MFINFIVSRNRKQKMKLIPILIFFFKLRKAEESVDEITTVTTSVQKFYSSPSIFILYDNLNFGYRKEKILIEAIRTYSNKYSMSQALAYDNLDKSYKGHENVLYAFTIHTRETLDRAIKATENAEMSAHPWLLFMLGNITDFDCDKPGRNFFKLRMDTKMMAKCEDNNVLKRYYAIFDNQTEVMNLAEWTTEKKLQFESGRNLIAIETDFKGITMNIATKTEANDRIIKNIANYKSSLMNELANIGKFHINISLRNDKAGYFDKRTQKWIGLMEAIVNKKADVCTILFSMSMDRTQVVDFLTPIITSQSYLFARLPDSSQVSWTVYFQAFNVNSWIAIGISMIFLSILLCLTKSRRKSQANTFIDNFINVWGIYNQQGSSEDSTIGSIRILYFFIISSSLTLNAIYSAAIASYITALEIRLSFSSYEEFKNNNDYKLAVLKYTNDKSLIEGNDTLLAPLRRHLKDDCDLPEDPSEGFQQVCDGKTALYTDFLSYKGLTEPPPCKISWVKMNRVEYLSFILPKNSPYTASISYLISRLREYGILDKLKNQFFYNSKEIVELQFNAIDIEEIIPIFAILLTGLIVAFIVYFLEVITCNISYYMNPLKMQKIRRRPENRRVFKTRKKVTFQRDIRFKFRLLIARDIKRRRQ